VYLKVSHIRKGCAISRLSMSQPPDPPKGYESPRGQRPAVALPILPPSPGHDPYAAFRSRSYSLFTAGNFLSIMGRQMLAVAVEWEVYARTHSATALGLVGLVIAIPVVALSLPAGHLADRFSRKRIVLISQIFSAFASALLALVSWKHLAIPAFPILRQANHGLTAIATFFEHRHPGFHFDDPSVPLIYLILFLSGTARTFGWAARASFFPTLVPREAFANAVTWNNTVFQIGSVVGPGVSGLLVAHIGFPFVYVIDAICAFAFFLLVLPIRARARTGTRADRNPWHSLIAGMRFVFSKNVILATITLDLFAVLLGGATALLPIFADQILHCGPIGLGWMRAAPAVGAFAMALAVAHLPPMRQAGKTLLWCVTGFGISTILFGISKIFWLSLGMLFLTGAFDSVSVIVRGSIVQLVTPDEMRGRVSAVNNIFIGTSNEFGALESGLTAAMFGPVISIVGGGVGTILVVLAVAIFWPEARKIGALDPTLR
jgi:MFS family permease